MWRLQPLLQALRDPDPSVRQVAVTELSWLRSTATDLGESYFILGERTHFGAIRAAQSLSQLTLTGRSRKREC